MKLFLALLVSAIASAQITPVVNVNSRYVVESIEVSGHDEFSLSRGLHEEIQNLIGENFDQAALDELTSRIKKELHAKSVSYRISRGNQPEQGYPRQRCPFHDRGSDRAERADGEARGEASAGP